MDGDENLLKLPSEIEFNSKDEWNPRYISRSYNTIDEKISKYHWYELQGIEVRLTSTRKAAFHIFSSVKRLKETIE